MKKLLITILLFSSSNLFSQVITLDSIIRIQNLTSESGYTSVTSIGAATFNPDKGHYYIISSDIITNKRKLNVIDFKNNNIIAHELKADVVFLKSVFVLRM